MYKMEELNMTPTLWGLYIAGYSILAVVHLQMAVVLMATYREGWYACGSKSAHLMLGVGALSGAVYHAFSPWLIITGYPQWVVFLATGRSLICVPLVFAFWGSVLRVQKALPVPHPEDYVGDIPSPVNKDHLKTLGRAVSGMRRKIGSWERRLEGLAADNALKEEASKLLKQINDLHAKIKEGEELDDDDTG